MRRSLTLLLIIMVLFLSATPPISSPAVADCSTQTTGNGGGYTPSITIDLTCTSTTPGSSGTDTADTTTDSSADDSQPAPGCALADGTEMPCWHDEFAWNDHFQLYCTPNNPPATHPAWDGHRDYLGNPTGSLYRCRGYAAERLVFVYRWLATPPDTPARPETDPETVVRTAVASLNLELPQVRIGAYVYQDESYGLSWWVGAPLWLWLDANNQKQWGSHTLSVEEGGIGVSATVQATQVAFNPGDGGTLVVCRSAGTPRQWDPEDPLSHHSPSGCEHTYTTINQPGDPDSRFTISATVTWQVTWTSTSAESGHFSLELASTDNPSIHVGELRAVTTR